jgi:hypothetical protein
MWCRPAALALNGTADIRSQRTGDRLLTPPPRRLHAADSCNKVTLDPNPWRRLAPVELQKECMRRMHVELHREALDDEVLVGKRSSKLDSVLDADVFCWPAVPARVAVLEVVELARTLGGDRVARAVGGRAHRTVAAAAGDIARASARFRFTRFRVFGVEMSGAESRFRALARPRQLTYCHYRPTTRGDDGALTTRTTRLWRPHHRNLHH